jgi:hypothetical protein
MIFAALLLGIAIGLVLGVAVAVRGQRLEELLDEELETRAELLRLVGEDR